jgi:histidine triad (HIT) family protein
MGEEDCLFCKIAAGRLPSKIVHQDKDVVAFEDINPAAPQHILFIPRRHVASMAELTAEDGALLGKLFAAAAQVAHNQGLDKPGQGYRFVTNVGEHAGQSVLHLHFHLLGGRKLGWPPG